MPEETSRQCQNYDSNQYFIRDTIQAELLALFGLFYSGVLKINMLSISGMWSPQSEVPIVGNNVSETTFALAARQLDHKEFKLTHFLLFGNYGHRLLSIVGKITLLG